MQQDYTIMVIDDDNDYSFLTKRILQRAGVGKIIITASNGLEAVRLLKNISSREEEKMPELILLDLKMPIMDGFEFLEEATKMPQLNFNQTRIYITTSSVLPKDKEKAYNYPIAGFIPKPITKDALRTLFSST